MLHCSSWCQYFIDWVSYSLLDRACFVRVLGLVCVVHLRSISWVSLHQKILWVDSQSKVRHQVSSDTHSHVALSADLWMLVRWSLRWGSYTNIHVKELTDFEKVPQIEHLQDPNYLWFILHWKNQFMARGQKLLY